MPRASTRKRSSRAPVWVPPRAIVEASGACSTGGMDAIVGGSGSLDRPARPRVPSAATIRGVGTHDQTTKSTGSTEGCARDHPDYRPAARIPSPLARRGDPKAAGTRSAAFVLLMSAPQNRTPRGTPGSLDPGPAPDGNAENEEDEPARTKHTPHRRHGHDPAGRRADAERLLHAGGEAAARAAAAVRRRGRPHRDRLDPGVRGRGRGRRAHHRVGPQDALSCSASRCSATATARPR